MRVLIVGCGYVGVPLGAELAKQGHEVFGLRRTRSAEAELKEAEIKPLIADITKPEDLENVSERRFDWVVNTVSSTGGGSADYRQVYLEGMRNLLQWLAPAPPRRFLYTSSTSVYVQTDGSIIDETNAAQPASPTSQVLLETEQVLLKGIRPGGASVPEVAGPAGVIRGPTFPAIVLRVAGIYGPARGYWLQQFLRGEAKIEGDGKRILNMVHRDDLVSVIIAALSQGQPGEIYNVVDDEPVAQIEVFRWLSATLGRALPPVAGEAELAPRKRALTNKQVLNTKLKRELGYQFKYPTFREGFMAEIQRLNCLPQFPVKREPAP